MRNLLPSLGGVLAVFGCASTVVGTTADGGPAADERPPIILDAAAPFDVGSSDVGLPTDAPALTPDVPVALPDAPLRPGAVDLVLVIDNSATMLDRQLRLARALPGLVTALTDPSTPRPVTDLHVGVVSTDLGTADFAVPGCANANGGDNGHLNPIFLGPSLTTHRPSTTLPPGVRPARCSDDNGEYPIFLRSNGDAGDRAEFVENLTCHALLSTGGCGLEQPLESAFRAFLVHRVTMNRGFLREDAVLAILVLTDEEDGSVRDCRYGEAFDPDGDCRGPRMDARAVYDVGSRAWSSSDLNLRMYQYVPGSAQDPTWNLSRYVDPRRPDRGFARFKAGRPDRVVFGAITGVPVGFSRALTPADWTALLGRRSDGSDGYLGTTPDGPVSMRQANLDDRCGTRVVPACRQTGVGVPGGCGADQQPFAWPARRIAEVVRRFDEGWGNGVVGSICDPDYDDFVRRMAAAIRRRVGP